MTTPADHDKRCPAAWDTSVKCDCGAADLPEALRPVKPVALIASIQELNAWEARADGELLTPAEGESIILVLHELKRLLALAAGQAKAAQSGLTDAYEGAREDLSIWKRRALEAERDLRAEKAAAARLVAELNAKNGPTRMGEPATPLAYGATEYGWTDHRRLEDGDKRLMALIVSLYGNDHQSYSDLEGLLGRAFRATPAQPVAEPAKADSVQEDALSDSVRTPLDSLHADAAYLIGRLREGSMPYARVIEIIRERIDAAKAAIRARASHGQAPAGATKPTEQQILEAAEKAGLWPNTVHSWIPAFHRYHKELAKAQPAQAQADSVQEDAARLDWLLLRISGAEFRRLGVHYSGNAGRADVDAARKQGANHD